MGKKTVQSGNDGKGAAVHPSSLANNGDYTDYSLTPNGRNSWWMVDLETQHSIIELRLTSVETMSSMHVNRVIDCK